MVFSMLLEFMVALGGCVCSRGGVVARLGRCINRAFCSIFASRAPGFSACTPGCHLFAPGLLWNALSELFTGLGLLFTRSSVFQLQWWWIQLYDVLQSFVCVVFSRDSDWRVYSMVRSIMRGSCRM